MTTVLMLGSAPMAVEAASWPRGFDKVLAINNAWRVRPDWDYAIYQINTCATGSGFQIERRIFPYVMTDIGNVHSEKIAAMLAFFHIDSIIKILGIIAVNRDDMKITPVLASPIFFRADGRFRTVRF